MTRGWGSFSNTSSLTHTPYCSPSSLTPYYLCDIFPRSLCELSPADSSLRRASSTSIHRLAHIPHNARPFKHPQDGCALSPAQVRTSVPRNRSLPDIFASCLLRLNHETFPHSSGNAGEDSTFAAQNQRLSLCLSRHILCALSPLHH